MSELKNLIGILNSSRIDAMRLQNKIDCKNSIDYKVTNKSTVIATSLLSIESVTVKFLNIFYTHIRHVFRDYYTILLPSLYYCLYYFIA